MRHRRGAAASIGCAGFMLCQVDVSARNNSSRRCCSFAVCLSPYIHRFASRRNFWKCIKVAGTKNMATRMQNRGSPFHVTHLSAPALIAKERGYESCAVVGKRARRLHQVREYEFRGYRTAGVSEQSVMWNTRSLPPCPRGLSARAHVTVRVHGATL
jgi:hypothetical protein